MTTPLKRALSFAHAALVIGLLAHSNTVSAQAPIAFGNTVQTQFTQSKDTHKYTVTATAGDRLLIQIRSPGVTLRTRVTLFDPADTRIRWWGWSRSHDLESPALSAIGRHRIEVTNGREVGEYTISVGRIDRGGNRTLPGSGGSP